MLRINMGGTFSNLQLVNSPGRGVAIGGSSLTVSGVTVNNGNSVTCDRLICHTDHAPSCWLSGEQ